MKAILIAVLLLAGSTSFAAATRTVDADTIRSSDTTKTYSMPSISGPVMVSTGLFSETPSGTINGTNTSFTLANTPAQASSLVLVQDGIVLISGTDYSLSGATITMTTAPALGQSLRATYSKF